MTTCIYSTYSIYSVYTHTVYTLVNPDSLPTKYIVSNIYWFLKTCIRCLNGLVTLLQQVLSVTITFCYQ